MKDIRLDKHKLHYQVPDDDYELAVGLIDLLDLSEFEDDEDGWEADSHITNLFSKLDIKFQRITWED